MASLLFEVMQLMNERHLSFTVASTGPYYLTFTVTLAGKRVEISIDEEDGVVDTSVFRGDESVRIGMEAVRKALDDDV